jgi:hypothetical protein
VIAVSIGVLHPRTSLSVEKVNEAMLDHDFHVGLKPHASAVAYLTIGGQGAQTIFLGDSNMAQYEPRIAKLLKDNKENSRGAIFITCGGVPPIPGYVMTSRRDSKDLLAEFNNQILEDKRIDRVVIAAQWAGYFKRNNPNTINGKSLNDRKSHEEAISEIGKLIKRLNLLGKKVTIVLGVPTGMELEPRKMIERSFCGIIW